MKNGKDEERKDSSDDTPPTQPPNIPERDSGDTDESELPEVQINYLQGQILSIQMAIGYLTKILELEGFERIRGNLTKAIEGTDFNHMIRQNFPQPQRNKSGEFQVSPDSPESVPVGLNPGVTDGLRSLSQFLKNR